MSDLGRLVRLNNDDKNIGIIIYETHANSFTYSVSEHTKHLVNSGKKIYYVYQLQALKGPFWKSDLSFI